MGKLIIFGEIIITISDLIVRNFSNTTFHVSPKSIDIIIRMSERNEINVEPSIKGRRPRISTKNIGRRVAGTRSKPGVIR